MPELHRYQTPRTSYHPNSLITSIIPYQKRLPLARMESGIENNYILIILQLRQLACSINQ
jgi:hypothetical protein